MEINIKVVTGIKIYPETKIYDSNGILFYSADWLTKPANKINLPIGKYFTNHITDIFLKPLHFDIPALPIAERNLKKDGYKIEFAYNPAKCTVNHRTSEITLDYQFLEAPKYVVQFILLHEVGHNFYKDESKADIFAVKHMLLNGYTKHHCYRAILTALTGSQSRKEAVHNFINQIKTLDK